MPYESIADARKAGFPCSVDDIGLTLAQINKLAEFYDTFKGRKNIENPMATAWKQWKEAYKKEGDKWVMAKKEGEQETESKWIPVAKKDQKKFFPDGTFEELSEEAIKGSLESWMNDGIEINHKAAIGKDHKITDVKYETPFLFMKFDPLTQRLFEDSGASGWSIKFDPDSMEYDGNKIVSGKGKNISLLYPPHLPTCNSEMGCHETFEFGKKDFEEGGTEMKNEMEFGKLKEDIKNGFEKLIDVFTGLGFKKETEEGNRKKNTIDKKDMEEADQLKLDLVTATAEVAKLKGEFETQKAASATQIKDLETDIAAYKKSEADQLKAEMNANWETVKAKGIAPGLVATPELEAVLRGQFEQTPQAFMITLLTAEKKNDSAEEGSEFSTDKDGLAAIAKEMDDEAGEMI